MLHRRTDCRTKKLHREFLTTKKKGERTGTSSIGWKGHCDSNGCGFIMRRDRANKRAKLKCQGTGSRRYTRPGRQTVYSSEGIKGHGMSAQSACCVLESAVTEHKLVRALSVSQNHRRLFGHYSGKTVGKKRRRQRVRWMNISRYVIICWHSGWRGERHEFKEILWKMKAFIKTHVSKDRNKVFQLKH